MRPGSHGYLLFEESALADNCCYVDGPSLGRLLVETRVPVLVLNACRSAHAEAPTQPEDPAAVADLHARIRAYGSLAQEVVDAGVPAVVAMRYNLYVVTAAELVGTLYGALLSGGQVGQAVTRARKGLAAHPLRTIAYDPRQLQDWVVPVAYEAAPFALFAPQAREGLEIRLDPGAGGQERSAQWP